MSSSSPADAPAGFRFSLRTGWDRGESALSRAMREARSEDAAAGPPLIDLTLSNPTACRFGFDSGTILGALADPAALLYDPDPKGLLRAREAVAAYYAQNGAQVHPEHLLLTTSTSEAYSFCFRLLCDPGDEVLVAQPGYPLFDFLAGLDDVRLQTYPLFFDFGWWIDFAELERRIGPRTRAILLVHPNNPTGHATGLAQRERLEQICARHSLALVVDEVFLDYTLDSSAEPVASFARGLHPALTFVVSGLSKIAALPQMKVGWLACFGPAELRDEALGRLEIVADTFLSLNAPAQHALPTWLGGREAVSAQIVARARRNLAAIHAAGLEALPVTAGWSAVLRLPLNLEEKLDFDGKLDREGELERLVREARIVVHPGSFYGFTEKNRAVVSLIVPEQEFFEGLERLRSWCDRQLQPPPPPAAFGGRW